MRQGYYSRTLMPRPCGGADETKRERWSNRGRVHYSFLPAPGSHFVKTCACRPRRKGGADAIWNFIVSCFTLTIENLSVDFINLVGNNHYVVQGCTAGLWWLTSAVRKHRNSMISMLFASLPSLAFWSGSRSTVRHGTFTC